MTRPTFAITAVLMLTAFVAAEPPKPRLDLDGEPLPDGAIMRLGTRRFRVGTSLWDWCHLLPGRAVLSFRAPQGPNARLLQLDATTGRSCGAAHPASASAATGAIS